MKPNNATMRTRKIDGNRGGVFLRFLLAVALFCVMAVLLWLTWDSARPPSIGAERAKLRKANLEEVRSVEEEILTSYGVVNVEKGIYRMPIDQAVQMMIQEWKQPEKARQMMAERVDLAVAPPPPPPETPSEFE